MAYLPSGRGINCGFYRFNPISYLQANVATETPLRFLQGDRNRSRRSLLAASLLSPAEAGKETCRLSSLISAPSDTF